MKLEDILNNRLKVLYRRLKKIEKILNSNKSRLKDTNDAQELLDLFLEEAIYDENIRNTDTSYITDLLVQHHFLDDSSVESELRTIKLLLKGIHDKKLKISLSNEQNEILKNYINSVSLLATELKEKKSSLLEEHKSVSEELSDLEEEIINLELLIEKITDVMDESLLTEEDLEIIKLISEDKSIDVSTRKNVLIKFIEYNNDRKSGKSKVHKVNVEDVINCFIEYDRDMRSTIKKYIDEVEASADIKNIRDILIYMSSVSIINKFSNADLLSICLYGNIDSVKETYEEISKIDNNSIYYDVASVWVDNVSSRKIKKKKYYGQERGEKQKISLHNVAHQISKEEMNKNMDYLTKEGFVYDPNEPGARKALTTDNYRLTEAVNALKMYGLVDEDNVSDFRIWLLAEPQLLEKIDRFVELGLLGGHNGHEDYANYLKRYPAKLHNIEYPVYMMMYKIKQTYPNDSYYETISSSKKGQLSGNLNGGKLGDVLDSPHKIEEYKIENFANYVDYIRNYQMYEDIIDSNYNVQIDNDIFNLEEIKSLEQNNRVDDNPYVYVFDGLVISRIKVLRNYSLIHDGEKDSLMASIVKGSFLTSESIDKIAQSINYTLGGNDGLSRKIQPK